MPMFCCSRKPRRGALDSGALSPGGTRVLASRQREHHPGRSGVRAGAVLQRAMLPQRAWVLSAF